MQRAEPVKVIQAEFPSPAFVGENAEERQFIENIKNGITLLNNVPMQEAGELLKIVNEKKLGLNRGNQPKEIREVVDVMQSFFQASNDVAKRDVFRELMKDAQRIDQLIDKIRKRTDIPDETRINAVEQLRQMMERYREFGAAGILNEMDLAKSARMLDTIIAAIYHGCTANQNLSEACKNKLFAYAEQLAQCRVEMANRMVYFLEIRQTRIRAKSVNLGFAQIQRSWQRLDVIPEDQRLGQQYEQLLRPFAQKTMQMHWNEGTVDLMQKMPENLLTGENDDTPINDYFICYINQYGSNLAKIRLLGCGATLTKTVDQALWQSWFNWIAENGKNAAKAVGDLAAVTPLIQAQPKKPATPEITTQDKEEVQRRHNRRVYGNFNNLLTSVHNYMRPNPEECIYDPNETVRSARDLNRQIRHAKWDQSFKGEHYAEECCSNYISLLNLIYRNLLNYIGTNRANLFLQILSDTISKDSSSDDAIINSCRFEDYPSLCEYLQRSGEVTYIDEAVLLAMLLLVKYKDYIQDDINAAANFHAMSEVIRQVASERAGASRARIAMLAMCLQKFRDCASGNREFQAEIDRVLTDNLRYRECRSEEILASYETNVKKFIEDYSHYNYLQAIRTGFFKGMLPEHDKLSRATNVPYHLFPVYTKWLQNNILQFVIRKLSTEPEYQIQKDLRHVTVNLLAKKLKENESDYFSYAKYVCFLAADKRRSAHLVKPLVEALTRINELETIYFQYTKPTAALNDKSRAEFEEVERENEMGKLTALRDCMLKVRTAVSGPQIVRYFSGNTDPLLNDLLARLDSKLKELHNMRNRAPGKK